MMPVLRFTLSVLHRRVTGPGGLGGQCVDLAGLYIQQVWGLPAVNANAVDWAARRLPGWSWVPNAPNNYPDHGCIVVWGPCASEGIGVYGHIAIAIDADSMDLLTIDQNWPSGTPCAFVAHSYAGVLGWHAPPALVR